MIKAILWDVDNTLLDFLLSENNSLKRTFERRGLGVCTDDMVRCYSGINNVFWQKLERGEVDREGALSGRFAEFFRVQGIEGVDPAAFSEEYEGGLADTVVFMQNARETVEALKGEYKQYGVTNGSYAVQSVKIKKSGLDILLDDVFISETVGYEKPSKQYFDYVLSHIIPCEKDEIIIIGDSLSSDMTGGNNAGIKCCWYNPQHILIPDGLRIDYEISDLKEVTKIIKEI